MRLGCGKVKQEVRWENQGFLLTVLLNLGQLSQLVVDLGVVVYTAELLGTDTHGVHVDHGTGVGVGGVVHTGLVVDGVADSHAEGDVGAVQLVILLAHLALAGGTHLQGALVGLAQVLRLVVGQQQLACAGGSGVGGQGQAKDVCLLYTSPSPRD